MYKKLFSLLSFLCFAFFEGTAQTQSSNYQIVQKISLPGSGRWDYLTMDELTNQLFVSHGDVVQVLDVSTGKLIATIPNTKGVHGITIAADLNKGYISNGRDNSVTIFSLKDFTTYKKVNVTGTNPDGILYDPYSHYVFAFNGKTNNVTVIDATSDTVITTIPLEGKPEFPVTDLKGHIYVNIEDKGLITVIDTKTFNTIKSWSLSPGKEPSGLAIDNEDHLLFSVCDNNLMIILNYETGKVLSTVPIGANTDGVVYDSSMKRAYSANGDGTMTVVSIANFKYRVLENVKTLKGARTIALNTKTHHLFLPTAEFGAIPPVTKENPEPRPSIKEGTFKVIEIAPIQN